MKDVFPWKAKKHVALEVADLVALSAYPHVRKTAFDIRLCASWLDFNLLEVAGDASPLEAVGGKKQLTRAGFCQKRTCPICNARRSLKLGALLSECIEGVKASHKGVRFVFLTLTMKNCPCDGGALGEAVDSLLYGYQRLVKRRPVKKAVLGAFRTLEVTYSRRTDTFHPHIHALLAVDGVYFDKDRDLYIRHDAWVSMWQECLKVSYAPSVFVEVADRVGAAVAEVAKYCVKDAEVLAVARHSGRHKAAAVLEALTLALFKRRLVQASGIFKRFWKQDREEDLLHITDEGAVHSEWYARYGYSLRTLKDYYLKELQRIDEDGDIVDGLDLGFF